jgi:hypothetical protein
MPKYYSNKKIIDKLTPYKTLLEERDLKFVSLYTSAVNLNFDHSKFPFRRHIWSKSDNLFRLSNRYYSTKEYWWVIAAFNQKPTDAMFEIGEEILIPLDPRVFSSGAY